MAPELRLSVGLDLAFFRQQMRKAVNVAQSEFTAKLNVRFNKKVVDDEIRKLQRAVTRKKFDIELNIVGGLTQKNFDNIQKRLDALAQRKQVEIPVSIKNGLTRAEAQSTVSTIKTSILSTQAISQGNGKLRIPVSIKSSITRADVTQFKSDVRSKLQGIKVKIDAEVGGVTGAAGRAPGDIQAEVLRKMNEISNIGAARMTAVSGGGVTEAARRQQFGRMISERTMETSKQTGLRGLKDIAKEFGVEFKKSIKKADLVKLLTEKAPIEQISKFDPKLQFDPSQRSLENSLKITQDKIKESLAKARTIDARSAISSRLKERGLTRPALPAAGQTGGTAASRSLIQGQSFEAPKLLDEAQKELKKTQPIAEYLRKAAINFAKNAPVVARYLNSFRAGRINISDLPGSGESPGRYISRIQEAMSQGPFGVGTIPPTQADQGFRFGQGPQLPGSPIQRALPPIGGTTASDRVTGDKGSAIVPYQPPSVPVSPPPSVFSGSKGQGGVGRFIGQAKGLASSLAPLQQARLPLTGAVSELTGEFGNAIKQVLLFGTAYKALAFITDLPNQAFQAAKSLDSFENQLRALTDNGPAFGQSMQFINDTIAQFNVPIESARSGFARLYASMEPAGIEQGTIEGLFTGISQAAATLSLSRDQVDRVTYAFSQMASKGKIMSEEVTGQLGDVIPGALSLMAEAANMSTKDFIKAMEDGALSGDALAAVLNNVGIVFGERFGKGAEGAATTLQGFTNSIQNSLTRMYEALRPLVNEFVKAFGPKLQSLIKDATSAFKALSADFTGTGDAAQELTPRAKAIFEAFQQIIPAVQSAATSVAALGEFFLQLTPAIVSTVSAMLSLLGTDLGKGLLIAAGAVGTLTAALSILRATGILPAFLALQKFVAFLIAGQIQKATVFMVALTKKIIGVQKALVVARVAAIGFTTVLTGIATLGIGLVIAGIATAIAGVGDKAREAAAEVARFNQELDFAAQQGDTGTLNIELGRRRATAQAAVQRFQGLESGELLVEERIRGEVIGKRRASKSEIETARQAANEAIKAQVEVEDRLEIAEGVERKRAQERKKLEVDLNKETLDAKTSGAENYYDLEADLAEANTKADIERNRTLLEERIRAVNAEYDERELRANSFQKDAIRLSRELENIELTRIKALQDARAQVISAQGSSAATAIRNTAAPNDTTTTPSTGDSSLLGNALVGTTIPGPEGPVINGQGAAQSAAPSVSKVEKDQQLAQQRVQIAQSKEELSIRIANKAATDSQALALARFREAVVPVAERKLQNDLLARRNELISQGYSDENINTQLAIFEATEKVRFGTEALREALERGNISQERYTQDVTELTEELKLNNIELARRAELLQQQQFESASQGLQDRLSSARAITPGQEIRERFRQEGFQGDQVEDLARLEELAIKAEETKEIFRSVASTIGDSFGQAFQDVLTGSKTVQEGLADVFRNIGQSFVQLAAQIIAKQLTILALAALTKAFGGPSLGGGGGSNPVNTIQDGSSFGLDGNIIQLGGPQLAANGAVWKGGFQAFANGGVVKGPTLGLVGEGKFNEAIVPLPDGRSIPVQMKGAGSQSSRDLISKERSTNSSSSTVLSMNFQTTNINGVEYVSREQLEEAMAMTRKQAAIDGASRGSKLTLDKLKNSPTTRRQVGIR